MDGWMDRQLDLDENKIEAMETDEKMAKAAEPVKTILFINPH